MYLKSVGNAQRVVALFGGNTKMAEICELESHLPKQWKLSGQIPYQWWQHICIYGRAAGVNVTPFDFIADLSVAVMAADSAPPTSADSATSSALPA